MPDHEQFEELCALAAGGALGHHELERLGEHLQECYPCRCLIAELSDIHAQWLPVARDPEIECDPATEAALRTRILERATAVGTHISRRAHRASDTHSSSFPLESPYIWLAAAAMLAIVAWGSVELLQLHAAEKVVVTATTAAAVPLSRAVVPVNSDESRRERELQLQGTIHSLEDRDAGLETELKGEQQKLEVLRWSNANSAQAVAALNKELQDDRSRHAAAEAELTQIKATQATTDAVTIAQQSEIERLNQKLSEQAMTIDREQQMLTSGRSIRDLIAARNLHIIDVYDTDSHGKNSTAFGRVFYTEGKSLIFYAYNLGDNRREKGEISFYVWGKQDGAPQNIRKLGALIEDDNTQRRWVFTLTDPKVLAEIDSVFVTLEPGNHAEKHPHGKHYLSAFLGSPANHP